MNFTKNISEYFLYIRKLIQSRLENHKGLPGRYQKPSEASSDDWRALESCRSYMESQRAGTRREVDVEMFLD